MKSLRLLVAFFSAVCLVALSFAQVRAQSPSVIYTWSGTDNVQEWSRAFGTNTVAITNTNAGELTVIENGTAGSTVAITDSFNRIRETPAGSRGGLDLTGLSSLEFDIAQSGSSPIGIQFYTQATPGSTFVALGEAAVTGGNVLNTISMPLTGLTADQKVYLRTIGLNIRDHTSQGNVTWTIREVRSVGTPLQVRDLITHAPGTAKGGLQGAIVNFDNAAVLGNDGGQNQTGLSHNPAGSGSLQWTDVGGGSGAAISWGNGTAWIGSTFNNRATDLSNYTNMIVTMSATDPNSGGGELQLNAFFQKNDFVSENAEGGASRDLPIDGQFHDLTWSLNGLSNMNVVDLTGINLFGHAPNLVINVDRIRFVMIPEPTSLFLISIALAVCIGTVRHARCYR